MAIRRKVTYDVTVTGAVRAADEIGKVDGAAKGAAGGLRGSGAAAVDAARGYAQAEAEARSLGAQFDAVNEQAAKTGGRFGDVRSRLGDIEDAFMVLSGVAAVQLIGAIVEIGKTIYGWTDAGKEAQATTEAQKAAIDALVGSLREVGDMTRIATDDLAAFALAQRQMTLTEGKLTEALDERTELEAERRKAIEAATAAEKAAADALSVRARIGAGAYATLRDRAADAQAAIAEINAEIAESDRRLRDHAIAHKEAQDALRATKREVAALGNPLAVLTEQWKRAGEAVKRAATEVRQKAAEEARKLRERLTRELDLTGAINLGELPEFDFSEIELPPIDASALTAGLLDAEREASFESTRLALERRRAAVEAAEATRTEAFSVAASIGGVTAAYAEVEQAQRDGMDTTTAWANTVKAAVNDIATALGAVRAAYDAISDAELISLRNAQQAADEDVRSAVAAERRAKAEADANKSSVSARAAAAKAAQTREAAEEKAYQAALAAAKAEEEAAAARQVFAALDMAAKGVESAADAVRAGALASFLAALPFGAGAPFVPAAIASAVLYGTAAVAYGVGAVATAAAPTPRSGRPDRPESTLPESSARDTVSAGDRERGREGTTNYYFRFGAVLGTTTEAEDAVVKARNRAHQRRGGAREQR